jgi:Cu+-exporting ATPase
MEKATFNVPSISCSICSGKIKEGLKDLNGIKGIDVDMKSQAVNVNYDPQTVSPDDIKTKIASMGYEVVS